MNKISENIDKTKKRKYSSSTNIFSQKFPHLQKKRYEELEKKIDTKNNKLSELNELLKFQQSILKKKESEIQEKNKTIATYKKENEHLRNLLELKVLGLFIPFFLPSFVSAICGFKSPVAVTKFAEEINIFKNMEYAIRVPRVKKKRPTGKMKSSTTVLFSYMGIRVMKKEKLERRRKKYKEWEENLFSSSRLLDLNKFDLNGDSITTPEQKEEVNVFLKRAEKAEEISKKIQKEKLKH